MPKVNMDVIKCSFCAEFEEPKPPDRALIKPCSFCGRDTCHRCRRAVYVTPYDSQGGMLTPGIGFCKGCYEKLCGLIGHESTAFEDWLRSLLSDGEEQDAVS